MAGALLWLALGACGEVTGSSAFDAGEEVSRDAGYVEDAASAPDAGSDAGEARLDAGVDAGPDEPRPSCPTDVLFCDDFEAGELDRDRWDTRVAAGAAIALRSERAYEGERALRLSLPAAAGARATIEPRGLLPLEPNRIYGRFYLLTTPDVSMVHSNLVVASGTREEGLTRYQLDSNAARLNSRYRSPLITDHGGLRRIGSHRLPVGEWVCVELLYDGEAHEMRYWFDGDEDVEMHVQPSTDPDWLAPIFTSITVGFLTYQATGAEFEVWYDAIAFDDERIGCE